MNHPDDTAPMYARVPMVASYCPLCVCCLDWCELVCWFGSGSRARVVDAGRAVGPVRREDPVEAVFAGRVQVRGAAQPGPRGNFQGCRVVGTDPGDERMVWHVGGRPADHRGRGFGGY